MTAPVDIIEGVPLGSLKRYLTKTGWRRSILRDGAVLFAKGDGDQVEIFLPATPQVRDLREKLTSALTTLTDMEERPFDVVAAAIRAISYDLVRSRLPESAIRQDTIRLGTAEAFIKRMHGALEAGSRRAACGAVLSARQQRSVQVRGRLPLRPHLPGQLRIHGRVPMRLPNAR